MALQTSIWLSLFGFYIINDAIKRDEDTKVGEILATTQLRNPIYILAKFITNIAILGAMSCIILIMSGLLQIFRSEVYHLDLVSLIVPFVILVIPVIFFVSGAALFFETFPVIRGTWSTIAWFFFWMFLMMTILVFDPFISWLSSSIRAAAYSQYPNIIFPSANLGLNPISRPAKLFLWNDVFSLWRFEVIIFRFFWYISALILAFTSIFFFHRFDPSVDRGISIKHKISSLLATDTPVIPETEDEQQITLTTIERTVKPVITLEKVTLTPLKSGIDHFRFGTIFIAETELMFKTVPIWWYLVTFGLIIAGLLIPIEISQRFLLPISLIWPLFIWSKMGTRESLNGTYQLIFSSNNVLIKQFPAIWFAGVLVALFSCSGFIVNLVINGYSISFLLTVFIGNLFIPTMALCFGVWTGSNKFFELIYFLYWYIGSLNGVTLLDFAGTTPEAVAAGLFRVYTLFTVLLLVLAFIGRRRQINSM
jgi:hypothetical protein